MTTIYIRHENDIERQVLGTVPSVFDLDRALTFIRAWGGSYYGMSGPDEVALSGHFFADGDLAGFEIIVSEFNPVVDRP